MESSRVNESMRSNLSAIEESIAAACVRAGRNRESVTLIGVSKTFPASLVDGAVSLGVRDIGENRVQELRAKVDEVQTSPRWHLIGHIQSNKAKEAARLADVIHTVDSVHLAERLAKEADQLQKRLDVLIQVNVGGEEQKSGVSPNAAERLLSELLPLGALRVRGLMTIPPIASPDRTRAFFAQLRDLRDRLQTVAGGDIFTELSMGMSDDFPMAIEEGATMIRVGRALFGDRG
ncbi:MAG TPA: YggS family pyridoxal phosphate-dependent enzyme [Thermoanaerobaculia bacterium]|nr:YggS family pyridoxal phosphate-dependent enzyme [Thermoanaerobaculia bacterium]